MEMILQQMRPTLRSSSGRWIIVPTSCPFCGASTNLPHESEQACIAALHEEIACTRAMVARVKAHAADAVLRDERSEEALIKRRA